MSVMVIVRGATLAGMAAAARLARLGHDVTLVTDGAALGTRWAGDAGPDGHAVDPMDPVITLPATWRDLFKKSGAHLVTALNAAGLELVEAPPVEHRFADGSTLLLPTDRGEQFRAVEHTLGRAPALRWQALLDDLDSVWAALRRFAVESPTAPRTNAERQHLWLHRSIDDVATRLADDRLAALVRAQALRAGTTSGRAPALLLGQLVVERVFGRWLLVDGAGHAQPASRLVDLLAGRLAERGVRLVEAADGQSHVDCRPHRHGSLLRPPPRPIAPPRVTHALTDAVAVEGHEVQDHTGALVRTWQRRVADGVLVTRHHHGERRSPDEAHGLEPASPTAWLRRTPIVDGATLRASACAPAGPEPWAELSSAALAVYALHERLAGEDARPTNKDFRPGRLPRTATK